MSEDIMILVTSAAGGVGRPLVRQLGSRGLKVRAFVKNDRQGDGAKSDGAAEVSVGDLRSPRDVGDALVGVQAIYHAAPTQLIEEMPVAAAVIEACRANGVEHIVYHSVVHPDIAELRHHHQKQRVEQRLRESGLPVTVLRPSHYMQNYLEVWDFICAGLMPYPFSPETVMGVVDVDDVAEVAATVLTHPGDHVGQTYDLSACELNRHAMARIWGDVMGHRVTASEVPTSAMGNPLAASATLGHLLTSLAPPRLRSAGYLGRGLIAARNVRGMRNWPADAQTTYAEMMSYYGRCGLPAGDLTVLPRLLGRPPNDYAAFARRSALARGWNTP